MIEDMIEDTTSRLDRTYYDIYSDKSANYVSFMRFAKRKLLRRGEISRQVSL